MRKNKPDRRAGTQIQFRHQAGEVIAIGAQAVQPDDRGGGLRSTFNFNTGEQFIHGREVYPVCPRVSSEQFHVAGVGCLPFDVATAHQRGKAADLVAAVFLCMVERFVRALYGAAG